MVESLIPDGNTGQPGIACVLERKFVLRKEEKRGCCAKMALQPSSLPKSKFQY